MGLENTNGGKKASCQGHRGLHPRNKLLRPGKSISREICPALNQHCPRRDKKPRLQPVPCSKTEQCCAIQASRDGFGQAIVKFGASTKCCLAQRACKGSQAEKAHGSFWISVPEHRETPAWTEVCNLQFCTNTLRKKVEVLLDVFTSA